MPMLRWFRFLVMERSKKVTLFLDSRVGLSWMQLWIVSMYFIISSGLVRVESYIHTYIHTYVHTYIHKHTYTQTHTICETQSRYWKVKSRCYYYAVKLQIVQLQ